MYLELVSVGKLYITDHIRLPHLRLPATLKTAISAIIIIISDRKHGSNPNIILHIYPITFVCRYVVVICVSCFRCTVSWYKTELMNWYFFLSQSFSNKLMTNNLTVTFVVIG